MMRIATDSVNRRMQAGVFKSLRTGAAALLASLVFGAAPFAVSHAAEAVAPRLKPAAPGPTYMTAADKERLLAVSSALKSRDYNTAWSLVNLVSDPIAKGLGQWMYLMAENPAIDFNNADEFLDANPDWPARSRIHAFVEKHIPNNAPADQVLAFFDTRAPVTGEGKLQLARALLSVGDKNGGEFYIRDAWINDNFKLADEKRMLSLYGDRLTKADHAARVDRMLWDREVTNARRVFSYLDSKDRRMAEARAALLLQASSAVSLYNKLPDEAQLDSGMLHAAVRFYRRRGDELYAMALASKAPKDPAELRNGGRWWDERQLLMRWALKNGRFADAYTVAAGHSMDEGADFAEAEFYAGWIALRFLKDPTRAETHFLALASEVGSPISVSRAQYWLGRAVAAKGDETGAKVYYTRAAEHFYSYYGQLAAEEIGGPLSAAKFSPPTQPTPADQALFASRPTVAALRMLTDLDLDYEFMVFAYHVDDQLERPGEYIELAKLTDGQGAPHLTVRAGKVGIQRNAFAPEVAYPLIYVPEEAARFVSPEIILGLSRQESEFNPRAFSRAGARGVMQIIPTTAQITARKEGLPYMRTALLDDPVYNMTIGSAHLSHLLARFDGSLIMTLAGYNAGASRVDQWVEDYGDPRSDNVDPLDWVELIPFSETRNYVQRVMENVQVYRGRLNDKAIPGRLYADLERGGSRNRVANNEGPSIVLAKAAAPLTGQLLLPIPVRTVERARRYALNNSMNKPANTPPGSTEKSERAAPFGKSAVTTAPVNFAPAPVIATTEKKAAPAKLQQAPAALQQAPVELQQPAKAAQAAPNANSQDDVVLEAVAAIRANPGATMQMRMPDVSQLAFDEAPETSAAPAIAAPEIAAPTITEPKPLAAPQAIAEEQPSPAIDTTHEDFLAIITPVIEESATDNVDDLSDADMDACLTYRDFLARNAEEDAEAADLNAGMLAELQGGSEGC